MHQPQFCLNCWEAELSLAHRCSLRIFFLAQSQALSWRQNSDAHLQGKYTSAEHSGDFVPWTCTYARMGDPHLFCDSSMHA